MMGIQNLIQAYNNMDIENLDTKEKVKSNTSFLTKPKTTSSFDNTKGQVRIGRQMKLIRKYRDEIKNGDV